MDELSIKIKISDRIYPMTVQTADEAFVRKAGKKMEEALKKYKTQFHINDPQDLLAMVGFDCLVAKMKTEESMDVLTNKYRKKIETLIASIDNALA